jgi:hypothetical protein
MPDPFVTVQDLSDITGRDLSLDNGAVIAIDAACDVCRTLAEQDFNAGTATVSLDGQGTDALLLPQRPVGTVSSVLVNGVAEPNFMLTAEGMLLRGTPGSWCGRVWPRGRQNVTVTYAFGYADGEVPRDVRLVALEIAQRMVIQGVATSETVGDVTINYGMAASDLTANELRILGKYRRARSF